MKKRLFAIEVPVNLRWRLRLLVLMLKLLKWLSGVNVIETVEVRQSPKKEDEE